MRTILHSDLNNFYASVECQDNRELQNKPVAVVGDAELRHGIVLAKNNIAKRIGIQTGEALWQAKLKCPDIVFVPARFEKYIRVSQHVRDIYIDYTNQVEPFGLDECWLDVGGSAALFGGGRTIADELRRRIRRELGLTISVGVSFNKVFAKLGSDLKKPDATTVITPENYRQVVWQLPVSELLYVGRATAAKCRRVGIYTIGDLAGADMHLLYKLFGKNGIMLWSFANGQDTSRVSDYPALPPMKTIGNSTTAPRDLVDDADVRITLLALCESVGARLREQHCVCSTVQLGIRDFELYAFERQEKLKTPSSNTRDLWNLSFALYKRHHLPGKPIRSLSVRACGLSPAGESVQLSLFPDQAKAQALADIDRSIDQIREKYGYRSIQRGVMLCDPKLNLDAKGEHTIHPVGFLGTL